MNCSLPTPNGVIKDFALDLKYIKKQKQQQKAGREALAFK